MTNDTSKTIGDYVTVKQLADENSAFTEGALRSLIFFSKDNGFHKCMRRVGRRVLISRSDFVEWIEAKHAESLITAP